MHILIILITAMFAGAVLHEVLHYAVWVIAGRHPVLDLWRLEVRPQAGPSTVTPLDRVAAAAPYIVGACAGAAAFIAGSVVVFAFAAGLVLFASRSDLDAVLGTAKWRL